MDSVRLAAEEFAELGRGVSMGGDGVWRRRSRAGAVMTLGGTPEIVFNDLAPFVRLAHACDADDGATAAEKDRRIQLLCVALSRCERALREAHKHMSDPCMGESACAYLLPAKEARELLISVGFDNCPSPEQREK